MRQLILAHKCRLKHLGIIGVERDQSAGVEVAAQGMGRDVRAATGAQVRGEAKFERHLIADEAREERWVFGGAKRVAEALGLEDVERAVDGGWANGFSGVDAEAQASARCVSIDLLEKLGGGDALVAADADADDVAGLVLDGFGEDLLGFFGAEVAHGVEDPVERGAEVFFCADASALHAFKERIELLAAPEDDADADEDFGVQAAFGGELFDETVGDEFEVFGIAQALGDRLEGDEEAGEILVVVERGGLGDR